MKREKWTALAVAAALLLTLLSACGGKKPFEVEPVVETLADSAAFSETLEELSWPVMVRYYGLNEADLEDGRAFGSTGATAEEFAVLIFADEAAAQAGEALMKTHVADQLEANRDYRPQDMPKLEKAVVERRENTLLLVVANDYGPVDGL